MSRDSYHTSEHASYSRKIRQMKILSHEEEYKLAKEWRDEQNHKSVAQLIEAHLRLVEKIASGYKGYGLPISDLVSEGNIGIMQAIKHYDPDRGFRFSTYAMWWIRACIQDYILQTWSLVKIGASRANKKLFFGLKRAQQQLKNNSEIEAELTPEQINNIAIKLSVKAEEVVNMHQRLNRKDNSLNQTMGEDGDQEWIEWISDERDNQEITLAHSQEYSKRKAILQKAMHCLNPKEHDIFIKRRLIEPPKTLQDISDSMHLSRERVRQIEHAAFEKIQKHIKNMTQKDHRKHI